ncbi:MAG: IS110 family transposase [Crocinitomicaceae bacterium]|nr:IS110 family transposase [Crocinitomicaceae bacterium]
MKNTIVGVDLAKDVIQVCIYTNKKVRSNIEMTPPEFIEFLANYTSLTIVFEACGTSNYWKQKAISLGHDARLISAKLVSVVRQNQKTDKNDGLAIIQAALLPDVTFISGKSIEQQQLQSIMRLRELCVKQKTAAGNQLTALLLEFNIKVSSRHSGLKGAVESTLEDAENGFSFEFRKALSEAWQLYLSVIKSIHTYDECLECAIEGHTDCKKLRQIEGVGTLNAINLYIALGCADLGVFNKGKDASACIGLTPIQYSSGGVTKLGSIGKYVKSSVLRSQLITGAMSAVNHATRRKAKTKKDQWIQEMVERRGKKCTAVALANKTVRTAFAMLTQNTEYKAELI